MWHKVFCDLFSHTYKSIFCLVYPDTTGSTHTDLPIFVLRRWHIIFPLFWNSLLLFFFFWLLFYILSIISNFNTLLNHFSALPPLGYQSPQGRASQVFLDVPRALWYRLFSEFSHVVVIRFFFVFFFYLTPWLANNPIDSTDDCDPELRGMSGSEWTQCPVRPFHSLSFSLQYKFYCLHNHCIVYLVFECNY